jgi:hypothetical protein
MRKILLAVALKSLPLGTVPSCLLSASGDICAPVLTHEANLSLSEGRFPAAVRMTWVTPLLKNLA